MARTKQPSKRKRGRSGVPALGAAGVSLVMVGGASANAPTANVPPLQDTPLRPVVALDEEEIADVSLATFYIFDKENVSHLGQGIRLAAKGGCGGCGCGCSGGKGCGGGMGCGGGKGCGGGMGCGSGCKGCGKGCGSCKGCGGCGCGGCGGGWWGVGCVGIGIGCGGGCWRWTPRGWVWVCY
jgi:hypothetical protein